VALGIGIDYSIHIITHFSHALKESGDIKNDISVIKKDIHELNKGVYEIKADMKLTRYMLGLIIAILVIPFLKNFVS